MEEIEASSSEPQRPLTTMTTGGISIFASAISVLLVIFATLLPLHNASQVINTPFSATEGGKLPSATSVSNSVEEKPTPKGGKLVGSTFNAKDLYQAYKEVETEYHTKAFQNAAQWKVLARRDDVEVSMMEHASDPNCPYIKMVAVIPAPVLDCWSWLSLENWPTNMPKMDPFYEGFEIRGNFTHKGVNMVLARKRTKRILAFGKRDMVFLSVSDKPLSDGTWVSGSVSVQTARLPRQKGYTRAFQDSIAFYKPLEENRKTKLTIVCRIDLNDSSEDGAGGWIPMWIYVKTVGGAALRSVTSMRDIIAEEYKTRMELERSKSAIPPRSEIPALLPVRRLWKRLNDDVSNIKSTASDSGIASLRFQLPWAKHESAPSSVTPDLPEGTPDLHRSTPLRNRIFRFVSRHR